MSSVRQRAAPFNPKSDQTSLTHILAVRPPQPAPDAAIAVGPRQCPSSLPHPLHPAFLTYHARSVDDEVRVRLKWGQTEYTGRLVSVDSYMNLQLSGAEEWVGGKSTGGLGQVLIR